MIKVLEVISGLNKGGTESFLLSYISELNKYNLFEFDIYSYSDDDLDVYEKFKSLGCNIYKGIAPSKKDFLKAYKCFDSFLYEHSYDVVHCNCNLDNALFLYISNFHNIRKRIGHYHDTTTGIKFSLKEKLSNFIKRIICKIFCTVSLGCSKQALVDQIGKKNKGTVIENIIDVEHFKKVSAEAVESLVKEYRLNRNEIIFGNISRFEAKKNQEFMVKVFAKYHSLNKSSKLILGGTGDDSKIRSLVNELQLQESVIFIGPRNDVAEWYHIFDFYLMPSLYEGFGISAVEAQVANCHVLASNNVPFDTDLGNIEYLSLDNIEDWIKASQTKKDFVTKEIDNSKNVELLKSFLI